MARRRTKKEEVKETKEELQVTEEFQLEETQDVSDTPDIAEVIQEEKLEDVSDSPEIAIDPHAAILEEVTPEPQYGITEVYADAPLVKNETTGRINADAILEGAKIQKEARDAAYARRVENMRLKKVQPTKVKKRQDKSGITTS